MSLVTSRRSLILGMTGLIACPMIARASSLMQLRGDLMDEWMVVFDVGRLGPNGRIIPLYTSSQFNPDRVPGDPHHGADKYARSYAKGFVKNGDKIPLLKAMSTDPRQRVRQLNLIRPYHDIHYLAMTKSDMKTANELG